MQSFLQMPLQLETKRQIQHTPRNRVHIANTIDKEVGLLQVSEHFIHE